MRILWASNGPHVGSGYGVQTELFVKRLINRLGHQASILAFYGLQGAPIRTEDYLILPSSMDQWGNDVLVADFIEQRADVLLTLMDIWVYREEQISKVYWTPWFPVDHDPMPPPVAHMLQFADNPIVYSKFGKDKAEEQGFEVLYVPHGVDTARFKPHNKKDAREQRGIPQDLFLAGIVAANKGTPSRKAFEAQIRGFKKFHDKHPDSILYLHTEQTGVIGEDLDELIDAVGLDQGAVAFVEQYAFMRGMLDAEYMASMYSAMDVLLNCTRGEGFGVPIIEAQSCGTPAIVTDFTAMPELAFDELLVPPKDLIYTPQGSYQATPDTDAIADRLEQVYNDRKSFESRIDERVQWIRENYDADIVTDQYWKPALEQIEKDRGINGNTNSGNGRKRISSRRQARRNSRAGG